MKKKCLLLLLQAASLGVWAQRNVAATVQPSPQLMSASSKQTGAFTIQLRPAPGGTYLYDILEEGKKMRIFPGNPVTGWPGGFATKDEAYKAAGWAIAQYKKRGVVPPSMPPHTARSLRLSGAPATNHSN